MQLFCMIYMVKTKRHTFLEQVLASGVVIEQVELNNPEVKGNEVKMQVLREHGGGPTPVWSLS